MVSKEDFFGSSEIVKLDHMMFRVYRYSDNERLGQLAERVGYERGRQHIKYERLVEVL